MTHTTDPQDELFDLVNENDEVMGTVKRKDAHRDPSLIHRAIGIMVFKDGQLYLQKRSMTKDTYPGYWTLSATGHVDSGETYDQAAIRELKEELGLTAMQPPTLVHRQCMRGATETEIWCFYRYDTTDEITTHPVEIEEGRCFSIDQKFFDTELPSMKITPSIELMTEQYLKKLV